MKIIFLCGCLEPGLDGVGDYTRLLATELINQGHKTAIISLNDKYISNVHIETQNIRNINIEVFRLPSIISLNKRIACAKNYIDNFDPDYLSLQFVIFAYNNKGLPFKINKKLASLGEGRIWHIMFHELWVGMEATATKKHILLGYIQKLLIKSLIIVLNPKVIHTNATLYKQQIIQLGFTAQQLSLFSNIPSIDVSHKIKLNSSVKKVDTINLVIFGNIFSNSPVDDFVNDIANYIKEADVKIIITFIGRCGYEQDRWADKFLSAGITINIMGEQQPEIISKVLGMANMGLSTYPIALYEKSGSVAAMLEHNLPVIFVQFPWESSQAQKQVLPSGIICYKKGNIKSIFETKYELPLKKNLSSITHQFVKTLSTSI